MIGSVKELPILIYALQPSTDGLINNSQTYCYWTARGLQTLKEEYINNPQKVKYISNVNYNFAKQNFYASKVAKKFENDINLYCKSKNWNY